MVSDIKWNFGERYVYSMVLLLYRNKNGVQVHIYIMQTDIPNDIPRFSSSRAL